MEWHHLEYFKHLANTENMSLSAEQLMVSQSALSRAIKHLETELGVPLFHRTGRAITLSNYGKSFLITVNNILDEMAIFQTNISNATDEYSGELTIGFLHSVGAGYMSEFLKTFKKQYPNIRLKLVQNHANKLLKMLDDGEADIVITSLVNKDPNTIFEPLITEKLYITINETHPFSNYNQIEINALRDENFMLLKKGFSLRKQVDDILKSYQLQPQISFEGDEIITIAAFISSDLGVSILPHLREIQIPNLKQIPIKNHDATRTIGIGYKAKNIAIPVIAETRKSLLAYFKDFE